MDIISKTHSPSLASPEPKHVWQDDAACLEIGDYLFFPEKGKSYDEARKICKRCDVREQCLAYALATEPYAESRQGMFGGLSPDERRELMGETTHGRPYRKAS